MNKYEALYNSEKLIYGTGDQVIITGWTPPKLIQEKLEPFDYAVIGNLYSAVRGINPLIRNLLWNPSVQRLVIIDQTKEDKNARACECLENFFDHGVIAGSTPLDKPVWLIKPLCLGYIDKEIPLEVLEDLRSRINVSVVRNLNHLTRIVKDSSHRTTMTTSIPQRFPESIVESKLFPGDIYANKIEGENIAEVWPKVLHRIRTIGRIRDTEKHGEWQEVIDLVTVINNEARNPYFPEPNYLPIEEEFIDKYVKQMTEDSNYQEGVEYTYGQRMRSWFGLDQIQQAIKRLQYNQDCTSVVISLWDSGSGSPNGACISRGGRDPLTSDHYYENPPCLNHIWLRKVDNTLSLTATFRSNDMYSAWVSNAMGLHYLQREILEKANGYPNEEEPLERGKLIIISQSAHLYKDCWEDADSVIKKQYKKMARRKTFDDPAGSYVIRHFGDKLKASWLEPKTYTVIKEYERKEPQHLIDQMLLDNPGIQAAHAAYLGIEIQRHYQAIKQGDLAC